jgi:hypothetical protein
MLATLLRAVTVTIKAVISVIIGICAFIAWCAGSADRNRRSGSYRVHEREIERRRRHR